MQPVIDQNKLKEIQSQPVTSPTYASPISPSGVEIVGRDKSQYDKSTILRRHNTEDVINDERFDKQTNWDMWGNSAMQTVGTVAGMGISGIGALLELPVAVTNKLAGRPNDMQNWVTQVGDFLKDGSIENFPIYTNSNESFDFDSGAWWAKNVPNIASTVGIMLPAFGLTKSLNMIGKFAQASKYAELMPMIGKVGKALQLENRVAKNVVLAGAQRHIENMAEGAQVYNDIVEESQKHLRDQNNWVKFMQTEDGQKAYAEAAKMDYFEGDMIDKVSHYIASKASWQSYKVNSANIVFDYLQTAAFTKALNKTSRAALKNNKSVGANATLFTTGKTVKEAAKETLGKARYRANALRPYSDFILGASSEGVEEIVNAVGTGEGMHYGKKLLGEAKDSTFNERLAEYLDDPATWEQGFWGMLGGGVFQGAALGKVALDKARGKVGNDNEARQLEEITSRKIQLANTGAIIKNLNRNIGLDNQPLVGTEDEINQQKQAILHKELAKVGSGIGSRAASHGTADVLDLMWSDPNLESFITEVAGEEGFVKPKEIISTLKQSSDKAVQYYDKVTSFFAKRTDKDYISKLIANGYIFDKTQADMYATKGLSYRKEFEDLLAKDAGYQELTKTPTNVDPANPTIQKDVDAEIRNAAIVSAMKQVKEEIKLNALQHEVEGTDDEITAFAQPVLDALEKQIVNVPKEQQLTQEEADTISPNVIKVLADAIYHETLGNTFSNKAENIFVDKNVIPKQEKRVKKHIAAETDKQRANFNVHLGTIASVTETSTPDEINGMINEIKQLQVDLSKGEVTKWNGDKDMLTNELIKDLNNASEALVKKLTTLREARRTRNSSEAARVKKNQQGLTTFQTDAADPSLVYDEGVKFSTTYGDNEYNQEVLDWVNDDALAMLETYRGKPEFKDKLLEVLADAKQAAGGVQKILNNRILEKFYGYETANTHQANTKTDEAVNNALAEVQKAMSNPDGIQQARFASNIKSSTALTFDPTLATERQIAAAVKLFNTISNVLNKPAPTNKTVKLTFDEVLDYLFRKYGTDYMSNPDVYDMIQKAYLIISVNTNSNFKTTPRNTVLTKFEQSKAIAKYGHLNNAELEEEYVESDIIQHTGGEFATNIFLGNIQDRLLRNEDGDFVSPNASVTETLDMLINQLAVGDTVVVSVNTKHESYDTNKDKVKSVPIKITIKKTDTSVEIGYVNRTDKISSGGVNYELDGNDFMDRIINDDEVLTELEKLIPALTEWMNYVTRNNITPENSKKLEDKTELETLTKALLDADVTNLLTTFINLHGENNKIDISSLSPALQHIVRVILQGDTSTNSNFNAPTGQEIRIGLQNWKAKLIRDKINHNTIRSKIEANIDNIIQTNIIYKSKGNVVRSINGTTSETVYRRLTDTIGTSDEIEFFVIETNSLAQSLRNADPRKKNGFNRSNGAFKGTLFTQVKSAARNDDGTPIMIPVSLYNNTLDGSMLGNPTSRNTQTIDYVYNTLMEYVAVRRQLNVVNLDETTKNKLHEKATKLEALLHAITPVINNGALDTNHLHLKHGNFTFTVGGEQVTYYFNRATDALFINGKEVTLTVDKVKELIGKLKTNVVYSNFESDTYTDPITGQTSSYKDYLLKHNIVITDVGMLVDEKGNKISNVTISNDNNKGGKPLIVNIDVKNLSSREIKDKASFTRFTKKHRLYDKYQKFYSLIGDMIRDGELTVIEEGNVYNDGYASYNKSTNTLTLSSRWHELNDMAKSLILMHEFIHKVLKADNIDTKYHEDLDNFRLSIINSEEFKLIDYDSSIATIKMLSAKAEQQALTEDENNALYKAQVDAKIYKIFTNSYTNEEGKVIEGVSARDNEELITYGLTDTDVALFLNSIKSDKELKDGSTTKWQEFKTIMKQMIQELVNAITGNTKLDELTALVDKIFEDVDSFIESNDTSPIREENITHDVVDDSNQPTETTDFNPEDIEFAAYASISKDQPKSLASRFKTIHPDGIMKRYFLDKQETVSDKARKINAILIKEGSNYRVRSTYIAGEPGDQRTYLGLQFYPTNQQVYAQYAEFASSLDLTKPIVDLRQQFNDYVLDNPIETTNSTTPMISITPIQIDNSHMGFASVHNFKDANGHLMTTNVAPFAYLGIKEGNKFTLQLTHKEFTDTTKDAYDEGSVAKDYFTNWGKYTIPHMFDMLIKQGYTSVVIPKFMFDEDTNDSLHEFAMKMEDNGMKLTFDEENITFHIDDIQASQQAIFSSAEFLDNYSTKFTASEEPAVTNLVSYIYRNLKNNQYKKTPPKSTTIIKNDIIKVISHHQKARLKYFSDDQITLQNRIIDDLKSNDSDAWRMTVRELRARYKHNPEELDSLLEDNDLNNKWEDTSRLFDNPNKTIGDQLKDVLASIPLVDPMSIGYDEKTNTITYAKVNNSLTGFVESADYRILNAKLIELLVGIQNPTEMLNIIKEHGTEQFSSYGKTMIILYSKLKNDVNLTNAFYSYYSKRMSTRYANLFRNSGEAIQHEQIVANKIHGKYVLADEWRNTILTNFDMEVYNEAWDKAWVDKYNAFAKIYNKYVDKVLSVDLATKLSELYDEIGITIDPSILQYYYKKGNGKEEFKYMFIIPLNQLKSPTKDEKYIGFIDKKMMNPDLPFDEKSNLLRIAELVSYFTFGKGRFSSMNVKKNVIYTPANPHYISSFMDKLHHKDDEVVMRFLTEFTQVPGSEYSFLLWGDQYNISNQRITGKEGKGFLNYTIVNGKRVPHSLNKANISKVNYIEFDGNQELSLGMPKEYTDLSDSEWDITNIISFFNSERNTPNNSDMVTMPFVIPSDSGIIDFIVMPKTPVDTTEDKAVWNFIQSGFYDGNVNGAKFDTANYFKQSYYELDGAQMVKDAVNSPIIQRYLAAYLAEIEEIKAATRVIFEIDTATGLPKRDANNMPIVKKGIKGQLFYHYAKHDSVTSQPIYLDEQGMPTGRGFKSHLFAFTNRNGKEITLNNSKSIFQDGFISQYMDVTSEDVTSLLLFRIHNHMHEQYTKAQEQFKDYKDYVNKMINKDYKHLLGANTYEEAVAEMVFNHQLFNIEQQRFFNGSTANYKSNLDTTKRSKQISAPSVKSALQGTFNSVTIADVKLVSSAINAKLEEAATAFKGLFDTTYYAANILAAAKNKELVEKLNNYEKAILDVIAPYFNNDSANAVSFITLAEYEKRIAGFGLRDYYSDIINKLRNNQTLSPDDYSRMIQLQKNFYYSYKYNATLQKFVPTQVKNAEVILTPSLVRGLQLGDLAKFMEENNLPQINVESAEKVGTIGIATIHDDQGNLVPNFAKLLLDNYNLYYYDSLGKQQDTPDHILDSYNKFGVQVSKKVLDNIDFTQMYVVPSKKTQTFNGEQLIDHFFNLYTDNIREDSLRLMERLISNHEEYEDIVSGKTKAILDYSKLKEILIEQADLLGLPKNTVLALYDNINEGGNVPLYYNVFYKKWEAILTSLFTNNVINQKHPGPHATQMSTLFLKPPVGKISNFTQSNVRRNYSQRDAERFANSNIDWAKHIHERKDYRLKAQRNENGEVVKAEVLLPRFNSKFFKVNGKYKIDELRDIDPKMLTMLGYRIPTEDKHSMIVFEVVGFLPDENASIILPDDFVTQSGADFDIDSLYMMMYNIEKTYNNKLTVIDINETNDNILYHRYYKNVLNSVKGQAALVKAGLPLDKVVSNMTDSEYSYEELIGRSTREIQKILVDAELLMTDYEFSRNKAKTKQKLAENRQGRENGMLDIMIAINEHPDHIVERTSPNGHDDINRAKDLLNKALNNNLENIDPSTYLGQREFRSRNISSRTLKAFAVSRDGLLSIFQRVNAKINNNIGESKVTPFTMTVIVNDKDLLRSKDHILKLYPDATFAKDGDIEYAYIPLEYLGRNSAGKFINIDGKLITSYSAQFTANILDGVKDELPKNVNPITLGWMETMVNLGATYNEIITFYNLPIINNVIKGLESKDNALKYKKHKSESILGAELFSEIYKEASNSGFSITRKSINGDYDIISLIENKGLIFPTFAEIEKLLKHYNKRSNTLPHIDVITNDIANPDTDFESKLRNLQYLSIHKYISYVTSAIKENTTPLGVDKIGAGPTFAKTKIIAEKIAQPNTLITVKDKPILSAIFDDFETSAYKPLYAYYHYGNKLSYQTFSPLFITENFTYDSIANNLLAAVSDSRGNPKRLEQVVTFLNKQLLHTVPALNITDEEIKRLIGHGKFRGKSFKFTQAKAIDSFNKLSLTRKIELMRKHLAKQGIDISENVINYFTLESNSAQFERNKYERISYIDNDIEEVLIASMTKLWLSDNEFERSIARDIVKYAYHVNGLSYSYSSLARLIPTSVIAYSDDGNYEMSANKGLGISDRLKSAFEQLNSINEETKPDEVNLMIHDLFGTLALRKKFLLSNYKDDNFVYNASNAVVFDGNGNQMPIFSPDENGVITVPLGNIQKIEKGNATLDYIKLVDINGDIQVYEQYQDENYSEDVYFYPINKIEYYDRSFTSLIPSNNVDINPNAYITLISNYITEKKKVNPDISSGINISVNSSIPLGKALNRIHYGHDLQSDYDINPITGAYGVSYPVNPANGKDWILPINKAVDPKEAPSAYKYRTKTVSARTIWGESVEAWYRANSSPTMELADRIKLLEALNHIKLLTFPELFTAIKKNGGIDFLAKSKHYISKVTRTDNWQGDGENSNYILTLMKAYQMIDGATIENKSIVDTNPTVNEIEPTVAKNTTVNNTKPGTQLDMFSQQAEFASYTNQDLIDAMTESGDLEIVCAGGAKAENGMFIGSTTYGDWEVVSDLKGFPKHSAGGVDLTVGQGGSIDINDGVGTFKAKDGVYIPSEPEVEVIKQPNLINQKLLKYL